MAAARSSSGGVAPFYFRFIDDVMFAHNGQE